MHIDFRFISEKVSRKTFIDSEHDPYCTDSKSPRSRAEALLHRLGSQFVDVPSGSGDAFLDLAEVDIIKVLMISPTSKKEEKRLVAAMTPYLIDRLLPVFNTEYGNCCVLVNSEQYAWMPQGIHKAHNDFIKPDQFIAPSYLVRFRQPYDGAPNPHLEYGQLADFSTRSSVQAYIDAKVKVGMDEIDDFSSYLTIGSRPVSGVCHVAKGLLYDDTYAYLFSAFNGQITNGAKLKWLNAGSRDYIKGYFKPAADWDHRALVMSGLLQNIPRYSTASVVSRMHEFKQNEYPLSAFLGAGGTGRVYAWNDDTCVKVCHGDRVKELIHEYNIIEHIAPNSVVVGAYQFQQIDGVAWFFMKRAMPLKYLFELTNGDKHSIIKSLFELHQARFVHGDARFRNAVKVVSNEGGNEVLKFKWIDFSETGIITVPRIEADVKTLFNSLHVKLNNAFLNEYSVKVYQEIANAEDLKRLYSIE